MVATDLYLGQVSVLEKKKKHNMLFNADKHVRGLTCYNMSITCKDQNGKNDAKYGPLRNKR